MRAAEITNPMGANTPSEFLEFPDYYTTSMMEDSVRERYPNKVWPSVEPARVPASGWFEEFGEAFGDSFDQTVYDMGVGSAILRSDDDEAFSLLEEEYQNWKATPDDVKDYSLMSGGFVGEVFGSITPSVSAGIAAGIGASAIGTPVAGIWTGGSVMAALQGTTAKGGSFRNTYIALRNKMDEEGDVNFEKAFETARRVSNMDAVLAVGEAAVSTMVPVARAVPGVGKSILSRAAQKGVAELSFDAAVGATGSVLSDSYAESEGIDRGEKFENALRAGLQEMIGGGIPSVIRTYAEYRNLKGGEALYKNFNTDPKNKALPYTPIAGVLGGPTTSRIDPDVGPVNTDMVVPPRKPVDGFDWTGEDLDADWDFLEAPDGRPSSPEELAAERLRQATVGGDFTGEMAGDASRTEARETAGEAEGFEAGRQSKINEKTKPGKKAAVVPVVDENGILVGIRKATRAEIEDMQKRGANPIMADNEIIQHNDGQILVKTRGGLFFEANLDGTISNLSPVEAKPFLTPDGLVLPLNEATDPDITAPDSRVTWKEAMVAFAEEIGKLQETFTLGGSRVSILDDEFLKQEGQVPAFARILKREMSENPKLMKLIAPHMVQGELSAEGLEIMQNTEVPSDLDAMTKNRLTAQGATTEDRTKQRYFETADGGKVAVQGHKFGNKTVGTGLADKSLESQVGSPARHDELTTIIEERLAELDKATVDRERKDVGFFDGQEINKSLDLIKKWEGEIEAGEVLTKKGKRVKLGPALIKKKRDQIKTNQAKIEGLMDASPAMQSERVNPMLQSRHAMLIEFLSDLVDPNIGPYPWEGDPAGKTIFLDGVKHLREIAGLPGEKELLLKLRRNLDAVDYNVTSANLAELTQSSVEISGAALRSKGMVQEGGLDVSMDVEEVIGMAAQEAKFAKEVAAVDSNVDDIKALRNSYVDLIIEIIDGPDYDLKTTMAKASADQKIRLGKEDIPHRTTASEYEVESDDEALVWAADKKEELAPILKGVRDKIKNLLALAEPNIKSGVEITDTIREEMNMLNATAEDVLKGFGEPVDLDTGKTQETLENFHAAHAEFIFAVEALGKAVKVAVTSFASPVIAPTNPVVSPTKAVRIKSKPFNRKLPALNLSFHKKQAAVNILDGASKWDERKGNFNTALEQETFRLAFQEDIKSVTRKLETIRKAVWLATNLEPELNAGRKSKVPFDKSLTAMGGVLENVETIEGVQAVVNKLIAKAKHNRGWKEGQQDGIQAQLRTFLELHRNTDISNIERLAQEGFGAFGSGKGRFWKTPSNTSGVTFEDPNQPTGNFYASRIKMRELIDAVKGLANMSGVVVMNIPFNIGAIPQIFKALVKLAIAFAADTGKGFVDFAKAIRQKPDNEAAKVAWEDAKTGKVRTTESYTTRMLEDIVKIIQNRNADRAGYKQAVALDGYVNANWARFLDRFSLQQYKDSGIKAPIKALFNRYFINEYIDLADIMARVAKGSSGGKPLTASEVEDIIRKVPDSKNAWYLQDGLETLTSEKGLDMDKFQKEFFTQMLEQKVDPVKFVEYLVAKHASERNAQIAAKNKKTGDFQDVENDPEGTTKGGGSGMGNRRAREIIAKARAEGKQSVYEKLNETYVRPVIRNTLDMARDGGLIDEANHTKLSSFYKHYVPLRGLEDSDEIMRTTGNGMDIRGKEDVQKRAMGRKTEATEVIPYVFQQWSNMLVRSEKVKVMQALANFIKTNPNQEITIANPDYVRKLKQTKGFGEQVTWIRNPEWVNDTDLVGFKVAGKQHYIRFKNKELAHSLRNQGVSGLNSMLRTMGKGTRYLSRVNTQYNPGFTIPNFIRDIGLARMTLKSMDKAEMAKELANIRNIPGQFHHKLFRKKKGAVYDALAAAFRADYLAKRDSKTLAKFFTSGDAKVDAEWDAMYTEMKQHGGRIQFRGVLDMESRMDDLSKLANKINNLSSKAKSGTKDSMVKGWGVAVKEFLEDVNTSVESSTRLAVYKLARDRGATPQKAAYLSRNSTINFTRRGKAGAGLNSLFMFYNASAQGASQILGNINHTSKGKRIAMEVIATGFAVEMFNQMFSGEDEDGVSIYEKIPEWKKNTNLIIVSPFGGKTFTFPLPYGYNALHYTGQKLFKVGKSAYLGTDKAPGAQATFPAAAELVNTFASAFNPIGGATSLARMITPDIGDVIIDLNANKDWKGADIYPEPSPFSPYAGPDSSRHWSTVNPGLEYIAKKVNEITGGDAVSSGFVDVSPETLEHVFGHIFGGAGSTAIRTEGVFHGMYNKEVPAANDIPIMRRFIAAPSSFYALEKFKNLRALSEQANDMYRLYVENGEYEDAKEYRKVNEVLFKIHPHVKNAGSLIRKINKSMRVIGASEGLSPSDKAIRLRRFKLQKNKAMSDANSRFVDLLLPIE